ncbi:hypothetical protein [Winogradskyella maritima]|uniref:Uncharacterized protein n=1 Tax=Winogradskyella maritima TaxID=1517766 RepID=A0ABV8AHV0_9FLAO
MFYSNLAWLQYQKVLYTNTLTSKSSSLQTKDDRTLSVHLVDVRSEGASWRKAHDSGSEGFEILTLNLPNILNRIS